MHPARTDPLREIAYSVDSLGVDYVDLYLVHCPGGGATWAWPEMEHACERSYTRSIGVSNFGVGELHEVMAVARTPPVVDQIQYNPFAYREGLASGCARQNIALEAYSPLGTGAHLADPRSRRSRNGSTARRRRCSCAGASSAACPRVSESTHRDRIEENARVFDFSLSPTDTAQLDALDRSGRTDQALERTWWSS